MQKVIASVAVEDAAYSFDKTYDYLLKGELSSAEPGCRVLVPFGKSNRLKQGIILNKRETEDKIKGLKSVSGVIDDEPVLSDEMIKLTEWLKDRTFCTLFDAVKTILPLGMCHRMIVSYNAVPDVDITSSCDEVKLVYEYLYKQGKYIEDEKILKKLHLPSDSDILKRMAADGFLFTNYDSARKIGDLTLKMVRITEKGIESLEGSEKHTLKQKKVLELLSEIGSASVKEICYYTGFTPSVVQALQKKGYAEFFENEVYRNPYSDISTDVSREKITLNDEQQKAYANLSARCKNNESGVSLLFGITGSGKTQVYLKLIDDVLENDRQVIVMVPEIALTPQTLNIFHKRYGKDIAVFHSALSQSERLDEWKRVRNGEIKIVVGTRSAVFAPFDKLGLIIIDEEQEHTYKSEQSPRYNAKDVAKFRCVYNKAHLILSSATPSVETYANAVNGRYNLEKLTKRYSTAHLPQVKIVDLCTEALSDSSYFSKALYDGIVENLKNGRQSILLINRRGYNTFATCKACGYVFTCPSCSVSMTYHHANGKLMCHYCGYSRDFTTTCPECHTDNVKYTGTGTQKIEDELSRLFPDARILRMDADSTMSKSAHEQKLNAFAEGKYDILVGTQMVAKGLDFENVTLVGVINADGQLYNDDFRSQERMFSLLTQVIGRAGRGKFKGTAVIQTLNPQNNIIKLAGEQNYEAFFDEEIKMRKMLIYPPYCDLCLAGFSALSESKVKMASKQFFRLVTEKLSDEYKDLKVIILGPMPAKILRMNNKYRYKLLMKCKNTKRFRQMISECELDFLSISTLSQVSIYIDMNPENLM